MSFVNINKKITATQNDFSFLEIGFRPFFIGASFFSIISISIWMLVYVFNFSLNHTSISPMQWHSHEMIYGYCFAVIAGFLLTAVANWTNIQTVKGAILGFIFILWIAARFSMILGESFLPLAAILDLFFMLCLSVASIYPIIIAKQWKQIGIAVKLILLFTFNLLFYLGVFGILAKGIFWGIYGGFFIVISLILTIGGRIIPLFISNALNIEIKNPKLIMLGNMFVFVVFFINQLFFDNKNVLIISSFLLFFLTSLRLIHWYSMEMWKKPLLWSLYLSFTFINLGFLLYALTAFYPISPYLPLHALAFGGIGFATIGMMARVSIGHTGRDIRFPNILTSFSLLSLLVGVIFRVFLPLINQAYYLQWIALAQVFWIIAFLLFLISYFKILTTRSV